MGWGPYYSENTTPDPFLLGLKDNSFTERQKEAIVTFVMENAFGHLATEDDRSFMDEIEQYDCIERARALEKNGWTIRAGEVSYDYEGVLAKFIQDLWAAVAKADPEHIDLIACDLLI